MTRLGIRDSFSGSSILVGLEIGRDELRVFITARDCKGQRFRPKRNRTNRRALLSSVMSGGPFLAFDLALYALMGLGPATLILPVWRRLEVAG